MNLYSWNVNGIRAAQQKGFLDWLREARPDILGIQETKAHPDQLDDEVRSPDGQPRLPVRSPTMPKTGSSTMSAILLISIPIATPLGGIPIISVAINTANTSLICNTRLAVKKTMIKPTMPITDTNLRRSSEAVGLSMSYSPYAKPIPQYVVRE